ncbi:hypothetical protein ACWEQ8_44335 [Streptomyces noursei]
MRNLPSTRRVATTQINPAPTSRTLTIDRTTAPCGNCRDFQAVKIRFADKLVTASCPCVSTIGDDIEREDGNDHKAEGDAA